MSGKVSGLLVVGSKVKDTKNTNEKKINLTDKNGLVEGLGAKVTCEHLSQEKKGLPPFT